MRILAAAILCLLIALPAGAATLAGVTLPDNAQIAGKDLVLNGLGLRKKFVVKVYVGGLYLPQKQRDARNILSIDQPRQMVMHFLYDVGKEQMCEAWNEGLEANTPNAAPDVAIARSTLCGWMEDLPKGNRLVMTYLPGEGTRVEVNGKTKGTLPGKAVADAILATWIGPKPGPGEDFKKAILGG